MTQNIHTAFNAFLESDHLEEDFIKSTKASWNGSGYSVELFPDGHYRVLWDGTIGNLYESPGLILKIPPLTEDEYDEKSGETFIQNAVDEFKLIFEEITSA